MLLKPIERLTSRIVVSPTTTSLIIGSASKSFSTSGIVQDENTVDLKEYKRSFDELLNYEKTPLKLRKFIYKPKYAEKVLRAELFDKKTGRPFRPSVHAGPPKAALLNQYLNSIDSFEELVIAKNYIRELDSLTDYLKPLHLINFIIKSGEFAKSSYGLKTVYNLSKFKFDDELVRFIYFVTLLKFEKTKDTKIDLLAKKLSVPLHKSHDLNSQDAILNLLSYASFGSILINSNYALIEKFKLHSEPLVKSITTLTTPEIPSYKSLSIGKQLGIYTGLKFEHAYLQKSNSILSNLAENDVLSADLETLLTEKIQPFVNELDELITGIEGHEDFLTVLESKIKFPVAEKEAEE